MKTGIYKILNKINGDCYIGSTAIGFDRRKSKHFSALKLGKHCNKYLQSSFNKHGEESFEFQILEVVVPEFCLTREQWYIDNYRPKYNLNPKAESCLGVKRSKETRDKLSKLRTGMKHSLQTRKKMSDIHKRENLSLSTIEKLKIHAKIVNKIKQKSIKQINKTDLTVVKTWDSISQAAQSMFSERRRIDSAISDISTICKKKPGRISAYGFIWEYN